MFFNNLDMEEWQKAAKQVLGNDFMQAFLTNSTGEGPRHNVYRNTSEIIVLIELPYVADLANINLLIREKEIIIKGKIDLGYEHMEVIQKQIFTGHFEKKISLPDPVNTKKVNAQYLKGILKIQLFPKWRYGGRTIPIRE